MRPVFHRQLSSYFLRLTGIPQEKVWAAESFDVVYSTFISWALESSEDNYLCAWGAEDLRFFNENATAHHLPVLSVDRYIDIKHHYNQYLIDQKGKPFGLRKALHREGMIFEGRQHRALDDAFNLCCLFVKYIDEWQR